MRFLESAPGRYDRGMRWLTLGRVDEIRAAVASAVPAVESPAVLEIGCGTGALTALLIARGAQVTAFDQNPEMLEHAHERVGDSPKCEILERTASEIDRLADASFDAVVASFSFSEMSAPERHFVLSQAAAKLRPEGRLAIADEVRPRSTWARLVFALLRAPQAALGWLAVGSVSRPLAALEAELEAAGFRTLEQQEWLGGHLALFVAARAG
ncbi:MAG: corrinoid protein-associated methyltransferase CpaM [Myxococcota bacterium]|nr:corrinoid protein-associated methyltransferase CpaM [Myxococcota bacterium]